MSELNKNNISRIVFLCFIIKLRTRFEILYYYLFFI